MHELRQLVRSDEYVAALRKGGDIKELSDRSYVDWRNSMLTMDALRRETTATSRIQLTQELNRSSSRGSAVLHKSVSDYLETMYAEAAADRAGVLRE